MSWFIKIGGEKQILPVTYGTSYSIKKILDASETNFEESDNEESYSEEFSDEEGEYESYLLIQNLESDQIEKLEKELTVEETIEKNVKEIRNINEKQRTDIRNLLLNFMDIFAVNYKGLNQTNIVECSIDTGKEKPIHMKPFTLAHADREFVQLELNKMVEEGILTPSNSSWAFPIVVVKKKGGEKRLCVDFRKLNAITKKDTFPLPDIVDLLESFSNAKVFSTLDLLKAFNQIKMEKSSQEKVTLICSFGTYSYTVMPFGITNDSHI